MIRALLFVLALSAASAWAQDIELEQERYPIHLGGTVVDVVVRSSDKDGGLTYLVLHDDENTAVAAAADVVARRGGRLVELQHSGERNIRFVLDDAAYAFDPNRMFTPAGADSTLKRNGRSSPAALEVVRAFADSVLAVAGFASTTTVVAVHNNTPDRYAATSYLDGGPYAGDARFVHVAADQDVDDFFYVTTAEFYRSLREGGFNVVLQDNAFVTDDGSLSVLCGRRGIPYVNVEAEHGHFESQVRMLEFLYELLDR